MSLVFKPLSFKIDKWLRELNSNELKAGVEHRLTAADCNEITTNIMIDYQAAH